MYEIRCSPKNVNMLKTFLCEISIEDTNYHVFPTGNNSMTILATMRQIIVIQNNFLEKMAIVPINDILKDDEIAVMNNFK